MYNGGPATFRYGQILNPAANPGPATTVSLELRAVAYPTLTPNRSTKRRSPDHLPLSVARGEAEHTLGACSTLDSRIRAHAGPTTVTDAGRTPSLPASPQPTRTSSSSVSRVVHSRELRCDRTRLHSYPR
jgi:hypothetical protein